MRTNSILTVVTALAVAACPACYLAGLHAGAKYSPNRGERLGLLTYAVEMHRAAQTTNLATVHKYLDTEISVLVHEYETRYGVPTGSDKFTKDFQYAQAIADQYKQELLPSFSLGQALGSPPQNQSEK